MVLTWNIRKNNFNYYVESFDFDKSPADRQFIILVHYKTNNTIFELFFLLFFLGQMNAFLSWSVSIRIQKSSELLYNLVLGVPDVWNTQYIGLETSSSQIKLK